jgi:hypothetical protein
VRVVLVLGIAVSLAIGFAVWRFSAAPETAEVVKPVDYELTADCLSEHQSWRNFNSTLADLEKDLRFCIEVWAASQLKEP